MIRHKLFLMWWLFASLTAASMVILYINNVFSLIYNNDSTKLSVLLFGLFIFMSVWCGFKTWQLSSFMEENHIEKHKKQGTIERIEHLVEIGWFSSDLCLTIGMVGTVIGFIMMLSGFSGIEIGNMATVQQLIKELGSGMSTALYTTLVGLVCSALLKIQYFNLTQAVDRLNK